MKETFDAESKKALIEYRIERAYATLKEADYNAKGGYYYAAINRSDSSRRTRNAWTPLCI